MTTLYVWTDDLDDEPGLIDWGLATVVLLPFIDDVEVTGWVEVEICPN